MMSIDARLAHVVGARLEREAEDREAARRRAEPPSASRTLATKRRRCCRLTSIADLSIQKLWPC